MVKFDRAVQVKGVSWSRRTIEIQKRPFINVRLILVVVIILVVLVDAVGLIGTLDHCRARGVCPTEAVYKRFALQPPRARG